MICICSPLTISETHWRKCKWSTVVRWCARKCYQRSMQWVISHKTMNTNWNYAANRNGQRWGCECVKCVEFNALLPCILPISSSNLWNEEMRDEYNFHRAKYCRVDTKGMLMWIYCSWQFRCCQRGWLLAKSMSLVFISMAGRHDIHTAQMRLEYVFTLASRNVSKQTAEWAWCNLRGEKKKERKMFSLEYTYTQTHVEWSSIE